ALGERLAGAPLERRGERRDRLLGDEDVPLRRVAGAGPTARPREAVAAGEGCAAAASVDDAELAVVAPLVGGGKPLDRLLGGEAVTEQREAVRAVARVRVGLRRDRAYVRLRPRHERADGEELRLRRDSPLAGF